jgi:hypothetical protein
MEKYNLSAVITLDEPNYEGESLEEAKAHLKRDLETRFDANTTNLVVLIQED